MKSSQLAEEQVSPLEEGYTDEIICIFQKSQEKEKSRHNPRFHSKSHGLLEAVFTVNPDIEDNYRVGLFKTPASYKTYIRFSNGSQHLETPDFKKSVRGMSIKVLNTGVSALEQDESGQTQDFLLTNNKIIFPGKVKLQGLGFRFLFVSRLYLVPIILSLKLRGLVKFIKGRILLANVLEQEYYSGTPYLFGQGLAVKWLASPLNPAGTKMTASKDRNFLRKRLSEDLAVSGFSFELYAQLQEHPEKDPIEDAAKEWSSKTFIKLATITIPQQNFNTPGRNELDRTIKFNPWHCMPAHRPLGGVNRLRRRIYQEMSAFRLSD